MKYTIVLFSFVLLLMSCSKEKTSPDSSIKYFSHYQINSIGDTVFVLHIPNGFTPNGDGKNDVFKVVYTGVLQSSVLYVYNVSGNLVYTTTDISMEWDGKGSSGKYLSLGVYNYTIDLSDTAGNKYRIIGDVTWLE